MTATLQTLRHAGHETFRSLGVRNFRLFFLGQLISMVGTWMHSVALIWVVLRLTDSGVALGLVGSMQFLPTLFLGAWGGVLADRLDRRRFLLLNQVGLAAVAVLFAALMATDQLTLTLIYGLSALGGIMTAVSNASRRVLVTDLVETDEAANAVALHAAMMTSSRVVGPALAGVLITTVGVGWVFTVNAVSYIAIIGALLAMDTSAIRPGPRLARQSGQLMDGLRYTWATTSLRHAILMLAVVGTLAFEYQVSLPLLAERSLGAGAGGFTLLFSFMSVGSVLGALAMARLNTVDVGFLVRSAWGLVVSTLFLSVAPNLAVATIGAVLVGTTTILLVSGTNALIQIQAAEEMRGRVLALTSVVFLGSTPIGGPLIGAVIEATGPRSGLLVGAAATAMVAIWIGGRAER